MTMLTAAAVLDVVIPVYNEEDDLGPCVRRLHAFLAATFPYPCRITVADNASTDRTPDVAAALRAELGVHYVRIEAKGRGRALKQVWLAAEAPVLVYMDVDLSTDLAALPPLVAPLLSGHSDLAVGSRLSRGARVVRGPRREFLSRAYNLLLRGTLAIGFSDAQCGFKAIRRDAARELLPLVEDTGWFFDTELLVLAERSDLRIHEVPVDWVDDPDSRVDIVATARADLAGIVRLVRHMGSLPLGELRARLGRAPLEAALPVGLARQLVRFAAVGAASTCAYLALYALLRVGLGAQAANLVALGVTAVANTAANRRLTFGISGMRNAARHQAQGFAVFLVCLAVTGGALAGLHAATGTPPRAVELGVLVAANLTATVLRFLLLRGWVFRTAAPSGPGVAVEPADPGIAAGPAGPGVAAAPARPC
ncbi:bifunctional glycosyltransferase family 2/GtrA family protein [Longispora sp. NPDC051575]|uniref:bifunctional glycosyltransferase family 2/GtrA family protein n=1 Tax=Longispora sp. NPDC051575 TaxID=3154943 RepID=UPI0034261908